MTDYTPYLRLAKPPFDDLPWDEAVNGNMDDIDAFLSVYMSIPNFAGAWKNDTEYVTGQNVIDISDGLVYTALVTYTTSSAPATFAQERVLFPTFWGQSYPAAPAAAVTYENSGRNKLHNSGFGVWQRGNGPFTTNAAYTSDRWQIAKVLDTISVSRVDATDLIRQSIGDENVFYVLSADVAGNADPTSYSIILQSMENVRRFAGKTVTFSFYAAASTALSVGVNMQLNYGTGGAPSASQWATTIGQKRTLGNSWGRYEATFTIPTSIGKTLGSNNDSALQAAIFLSSGANSDLIAGSIGLQTGIFQVWGMQLEFGSAATPLEKGDSTESLANCQRFYQPHVVWVPGAAAEYAYIPFPVAMHRTPTITGGAAGFTELNTSIYGTNVRQTVAAIQSLNFNAEF